MSNIFNDAIYLEDIPKDQWKNYIGNGYRSCVYTTNIERNGQIILFGFDKQDNPKTFICPWESHVSYNVKFQTNEKDIYDRYVSTKYFKSKFLRDKFIENSTGLNIVEALKPEQEFLHFMFDDVVLNDDFNKQNLRIQYIDIETEISEQFMRPAVAGNRINMITIYDSQTEKFYTWSLQHAEIDFTDERLSNLPKEKFVFKEFHDDEENLLRDFIEWTTENYPDISYGWNIVKYDWPYIVRRIENVLGKTEAKKLSPVKRYFIKNIKHEKATEKDSEDIEVVIDGLFIADGLILYRDKFDVPGGSLDGGYSLNNVGEHEGLGKKVDYDGTLKDLYLQNYQKFYEYNLIDVALVKQIDDKCKMIQLARQITSFGLTNYSAIYSSISYLIGSVLAFSKVQMNGKIFTSYLGERKHFDGFEGAFVFPTQCGVYSGGIGVIDFASLYPSNIRSINASPETYVGKLIVRYKDEFGNILPANDTNQEMFNIWNDAEVNNPNIAGYELKLPNGKKKPITLEQVKELLETKCIYTANNTLFLKHEIKWGVIAKWCEYFYNLRKATKKKELECYHKLHNQKLKLSEEEKHHLEIDNENYHTIQLGIKTMINSIYGCTGTAFSPIANPDIAQSITRQGRFCNQTTAKYILSQFIKKYGVSGDYAVSIGGDTDTSNLDTKIRILSITSN